MKTAIYIRVSTDEQAKHGYSIAAQLEKLEAFCVSQGWEVTSVYIDDGQSAKNLDRPKFIEMINEVQDGQFDVLLVYKLDRLTRSVLDLYKILKVLDDHNCSFKSATEVYDTTNAMGRLFITLVAAIAQWERENLAERVRFGMEKKTKLGLWKGGKSPYGYTILDKRLILNEDEADVVKEIFTLSKTKGFYTIAKLLTNKSYPTRSGNDWHVDSVRDIANNPVYAGYLTFSENPKEYKKPPREKKLFEGEHPRIIERDTFWELQDILDKRRVFGGKRETSNYYFSSILKCARCGHSMSGHKGNNNVKTYRCSGKKAGKSCTSHIIKEDNLVKTIFSQFDNLVEDIYGGNKSEDISQNDINKLEDELKQIEKLISKQKKMYEKDIIEIDELILKTEQYRTREKECVKQLKTIKHNSIQNTEEITFITDNIEALWNHANDHEKKQLMTTLFNQIVIDTKDEYKRKNGHREIIITYSK